MVMILRNLIVRYLRSAWRWGLMRGLRGLGWRPGENLRIRRRVRWRGIDTWPQGLKQRVRHLLDWTFTAASRESLLGLDQEVSEVSFVPVCETAPLAVGGPVP